MSIVSIILALLIFSLIVIFHELGHFLLAKRGGIRVNEFSLGMGPTLLSKQIGETKYCLKLLPFGGSCMMEGEDGDYEEDPGEGPEKAGYSPDRLPPYSFGAKSVWTRISVVAAGPVFNFILAFFLALFIYAMILFTWGDTYTPISNIKEGFKFNETARNLGFRDGDIPLRTDAKTFDRFDVDIFRDLSTAHSVTVLRNGEKVTFALPGDLNLIDMLKSQPPFMALRIPSIVDSVAVGGPAAKAGIRAGDQLLTLNNVNLTTWNEFEYVMYDLREAIKAYREDGNTFAADSLSRLTVVVCHQQTSAMDTLSLSLDKNGSLGVYYSNPLVHYEQVTRHYSFLESFPAGISHGWAVLVGYVEDLKYLFTADGVKSVGSFGTIGNMFPAQWDWLRFWELTAFISLMLAFMNILPIPALDGGHVLFLLYEVITRRKPSEKFMEYAQTAGMWFLFALMAFAIFNDCSRFLF